MSTSTNALTERYTATDVPLISIVIINYNYARFLAQAIESALHQTYRNIEIIVVDDCSTDNSKEVIAQYPSISVIIQHKRNTGVVESVEDGIRKSNGAFYVLLAADDVLSPTFVEDCYNAIKDKPFTFAYTGCYIFGAHNAISMPPEHSNAQLYCGNYISDTSLIPRYMFFTAEPYMRDLKSLEDWQHMLSYIRAGFKPIPVKKPLFYWRRHEEGSRNTDMVEMENAANIIRERYKDLWHWYYYPLLIYRKCVKGALVWLRNKTKSKTCYRRFANWLYKKLVYDIGYIALVTQGWTDPPYTFLKKLCCKNKTPSEIREHPPEYDTNDDMTQKQVLKILTNQVWE